MSIAYEAELKDRVERLVNDVGPLSTVSLLGFAEADRKKADAAVRRLSGFNFVDLRATRAHEVGRVLKDKLSGPSAELLVVALRHERPAQPITELVRSFVEKSPARPAGLSVVLVVDGAGEHAELPPELKIVPYEEYLPR